VHLASPRVRFYFTKSKAQVFREELRALGPHAAASLADAMKRHSKGQSFAREVKPLGRRVKKHLLHEIRVTVDSNEYRAIFAPVGRGGHVMLALTALHKQTKAIPKADLDRAEARLRDWLDRGDA
jgi:phage-related protein